MKPHPRIRKTVKWGGAVATVLLAVVWIGSGWRMLVWFGAGKNVNFLAVGGGGVEVGHLTATVPFQGSMLLECREPIFQLPGFGSAATGWGAYLPLWPGVAAALVATAAAWRLDTLERRRRAGVNHCRNCGYDRRGLPPQTVCPECGAAAGHR